MSVVSIYFKSMLAHFDDKETSNKNRHICAQKLQISKETVYVFNGSGNIDILFVPNKKKKKKKSYTFDVNNMYCYFFLIVIADVIN